MHFTLPCRLICLVSDKVRYNQGYFIRLDERESRKSRHGGKTRQLVALNCFWPATELEYQMGELFVLLKESKEKAKMEVEQF